MTGMDERQLERIAARLGTSEAEGVDLDHVATRVVSRLRSGEKIPTRRRAWPWLVAAAAAATLAVPGYKWLNEDGGGGGGRGGGTPSAQVVAAPELDLLTDTELVEVLDSLDFQAPVTQVVTATLDDMNRQQLEELLAIMEG
jgi:hypothetical protein